MTTTPTARVDPAPAPAAPAPAELYLDLLKKTLTAFVFPESSNRVLLSPERPGVNPKQLAKAMAVRAAGRMGYRLVKHMPFSAEDRRNGRDWPQIAYTMIGLRRLDNVQRCVEEAVRNGVPGDLIETGVWRGGSVIFMRGVLRALGDTQRTVWAADSFEGLPKPDTKAYAADEGYDLSENSYLKVSLEDVRQNFERFGLLDDQVRFLKGWFKDTLHTAPIERLAVLRLDGDLYESTMDALTALGHKVSRGGFIIVDDYHNWPNCKLAVDEYRSDKGITAPIVEIDGMAVYWKVE